MVELTGADHPKEAWRRFFEPEDVVGIKVNPVGKKPSGAVGTGVSPVVGAISNPAVLIEVVEGLKSAGVKAKKKKLTWATLTEVTSAAPHRVKARCPHFQTCGGCHYQHIDAAEQLKLKKDILRETLSRLGGISWEGPIQEHSAEPYGYRNRAQWAVRTGFPQCPLLRRPRRLGRSRNPGSS